MHYGSLNGEKACVNEFFSVIRAFFVGRLDAHTLPLNEIRFVSSNCFRFIRDFDGNLNFRYLDSKGCLGISLSAL